MNFLWNEYRTLASEKDYVGLGLYTMLLPVLIPVCFVAGLIGRGVLKATSRRSPPKVEAQPKPDADAERENPERFDFERQ